MATGATFIAQNQVLGPRTRSAGFKKLAMPSPALRPVAAPTVQTPLGACPKHCVQKSPPDSWGVGCMCHSLRGMLVQGIMPNLTTHPIFNMCSYVNCTSIKLFCKNSFS